ncbi:MAG: AAA family ATPase [Pseudonocardia sp.]|nr:AAA family ATPase [Pseudonocardia sp.]
MRIELLGGFRVLVDGAAVPDAAWRRRRPAELVAQLALASGRRLHRDAVVEALWPELDGKAGLANLHKAAHLARRAVDSIGAVVLEADQVCLWPGTEAEVEVDVEGFEASARRALRSGCHEACIAAARLYAGELLPGTPDRFDEVRQRLRAMYLELLRTAQRWDELIEAEPTDEQAGRALMRRGLEAGDTEAALRRFRQLSAALAELGLRPGTRTQEMYERALGGAVRTRPAPRRDVLLGRGPALTAARRVLRAAIAGEGGTLLVDGPPGIGKTRFALALVDEAVDAGWTVVRAAASDTDGPVPYSPVAAALARLTGARPDLLPLLSPRARDAVNELVAGGGRTDQGCLLPAVAQLVVAAAGSGVTVFVLDDAHAADDATIELLAHLAGTARFEPVVLVVTFRTHEIPPALARLVDSLLARRVGVRLRLSLLGAEDAAVLTRRGAPYEPSEAALGTIWRLAEGNPLFTEELAAAIGPGGTVPEVVDIPSAVTARFGALAPADRDGLQRLAVAGHAFTVDEASQIAGGDAPGLLDRAIALDLLAPRDGGVEFRHALVREALNREVSPHRRVGVPPAGGAPHDRRRRAGGPGRPPRAGGRTRRCAGLAAPSRRRRDGGDGLRRGTRLRRARPRDRPRRRPAGPAGAAGRRGARARRSGGGSGLP